MLPEKLAEAAAFGRLCVETLCQLNREADGKRQPPSGGCVLKHQAFGFFLRVRLQPPSGGCVLKPPYLALSVRFDEAAAFGRLCVETP